jgi:hypothetical protein
MRASEVGARLGGAFGARRAALERDQVHARSALALALAATAPDARERVLAIFLSLGHGEACARVACECAHTSAACVCALLVDESRLYSDDGEGAPFI